MTSAGFCEATLVSFGLDCRLRNLNFYQESAAFERAKDEIKSNEALLTSILEIQFGKMIGCF